MDLTVRDVGVGVWRRRERRRRVGCEGRDDVGFAEDGAGGVVGLDGVGVY